MNVEMIATHVQLIREEEHDEPDWELLFSHDGCYISIGLSDELFEALRQWMNNYHGSATNPRDNDEGN